MIYITGDCHGNFIRFCKKAFPEQEDMTRDDYVIICGDFGGIWENGKLDRLNLDWLSSKNFTTLFVCGNHENFGELAKFPVVDFHGGKAHQIRENVYHLMRGEIFELCGKKIFAFGGASSHDIQDGILDAANFKNEVEMWEKCNEMLMEHKMFRIKDLSWWEQELPTEEEMNHGLQTLAENGNEVDFIVTHCCPQHVASMFSRGLYKSDCLTQYFNRIAEENKFTKWYFGHYHDNRQVMGKFIMLYDNLVRIV